MNTKKFFALAQEKGIAQSQIQISVSSATSISLFHGEIDSYEVNSSQQIVACGIYNGKFGMARTEKLGKDTFEFLTNEIINSATYNEAEEEASLFEGSEKYHKKNLFNEALAATPVSEKLAKLRKLEEAVYAADPSVAEVQCGFEEKESSSEFYNSFGLKLKQRSNYFDYYAQAVLRKGEETKTNFDVCLDSDFSKFDPEAMAKGIVAEGLKKFGGKPCNAGKYPTVLDRDIVASLLIYLLSSASAEEVMRHSSFLEGKLGQKISSSKLTIVEKPLEKNVFFSYFDDEGVATTNKPIIKNGVLQTYFHNRKTAKVFGTTSTGNGQWQGAKIGVGFSNLFVKPGKVSFEQMIADIKEGVYITSIAGLGTGINPQSGDFSCQAEGFMIRDGKVAEPLNLITLSGNLLKMVKDLKALDSNVKLTLRSISTPNAYIKSMSIGGN